MARSVRNANLDSRAARARLSPGSKHWGNAGLKGLHVGYRRGPRGGTWYARRMSEGRYILTTLGSADDYADADGAAVLNYSQALVEARNWGQTEARKADGLGDHRAAPYTVNAACDDYLKFYVEKGGKSEYSTKLAINAHIRPTLGTREVAKLTTPMLRDWLRAVATAPKRVRTKKAAVERAAKPVDTGDANAMRSRRSSANRLLNVLKAILNHAWHERNVSSDDAWRAIKPYAKADAPVVRYLTADECRRLVNTCPPALRKLVRGALLTGARYGELAKLKVRDVNLETGMLAIPVSKSGRARHVVLTDEGRELFAELVAGKQSGAPVFVRDDGCDWGHAHQFRPLRDACARVAIAPAIGFHILRHTHAATLAMAGVPMGVIAAQLGHADTRITERHYAHLSPSYVAETIRANFPALNLSTTVTKAVRLQV